MTPLVAIVGRPNVGKSTMFNRLLRRHQAIVEDAPGVTRDRHYGEAEWEGRHFTLIDTGGFVPGERDALLTAVREQAQLAVEEADAILFVCDARAGLTAADQEVADFLRRSGKPLVLAVNKVDTPDQAAKTHLAEFYRLGLSPLIPVSAEHAVGQEELVSRLLELVPPTESPEPTAADGIRLAIVGRPNVGKSTLVNAILGEERFVSSPFPGTTRDAIDTRMKHRGRPFVLTDTAGIRRKKTIAHRVEQFAVVAALKAIERSDVAALVIDATEPAVDQDARIAQLAEDHGRALMLVVNKWDLVPKPANAEENFRAGLKERFKFISYAPVVFTSAVRRQKVDKVLEVAAELHDELTFRAPTPRLNRLLEHVQNDNPAPIARGKPIRLYYIAQVSAAPPTFLVTCNLPQEVPQFYKRYLVNQIRQSFRLRVPIRLLLRGRPGQAKRAARKRPSRA